MAKKVAAKVNKPKVEEKVVEAKTNGRSSSRNKKLFPTVNENPFKRGWSYDSWEKIASEPGKTFKQYVAEGGRVPAISHAVRVGWLRTED